MKNSPKRNVSCLKKRAQNTQKEHAKILRNKANGFMKVRLSLRLLSLRSNRFRLLVAKRKKRGKRVKVLIVQLCLGVVPRCAALAMATSLFVIVQLFIRALDGLQRGDRGSVNRPVLMLCQNRMHRKSFSQGYVIF